jgi:hypothetical protein
MVWSKRSSWVESTSLTPTRRTRIGPTNPTPTRSRAWGSSGPVDVTGPELPH